MSISLALTEAVISAAKQFAPDKKLPAVNIAVCDAAAHLVGFARMDGALLGGIDVATMKARTAALFLVDTHILADRVAPGGPV
jgi:uncharacterized protein GlcG (DUF336 family)